MPSEKCLNEFSAGTPLREVLICLWQQRSSRVRELLHAILATEAPQQKEIHQIRVASRRLKAYLDIFADELPRAKSKLLAGTLDKLRSKAGDTRNLDVFQSFLESLASNSVDPAASPEDWELIRGFFEHRRTIALEKLKKQLPVLLAMLEPQLLGVETSLEKSRGKRSRSEKSQATTIGEYGLQTLPELTRQFFKRVHRAQQDPHELHRLRIKGKEFRYTMELFGPLLGKHFQEELSPRLELVQDLLGQLQDAQVAEEHFEELEEARSDLVRRGGEWKKEERKVHEKELKKAISRLRKANEDRRDRTLAEFGQLVADWEQKDLRGLFLAQVQTLENLPDTLTIQSQEDPSGNDSPSSSAAKKEDSEQVSLSLAQEQSLSNSRQDA